MTVRKDRGKAIGKVKLNGEEIFIKMALEKIHELFPRTAKICSLKERGLSA